MMKLDAKRIGVFALMFNYGILPVPYGIGGLIPPGIKNTLWFKSVMGLSKDAKKNYTTDYEHAVYTLLRANMFMLVRNKSKNIIAFSFYVEPIVNYEDDIDQVDDVAVLIYPEDANSLYSIYSLSDEKGIEASLLKENCFFSIQEDSSEIISSKIKDSDMEIAFYVKQDKYRKYKTTRFLIANKSICFYSFDETSDCANKMVCVDSFEKIVYLAKSCFKNRAKRPLVTGQRIFYLFLFGVPIILVVIGAFMLFSR